MYNNNKPQKTQTNSKKELQKKEKYSELGLDPPTHFQVFLGFLDFFLPWQNPLVIP